MSRLSARQLAGGALLAGFVVVLVGAAMWMMRSSGSVERGLWYMRVERGFIMVAAVVNAAGFVALARLLRRAGDPWMATVGAVIFVVGVGFLIFAEIRSTEREGAYYPAFVVYVFGALTAQAFMGGSLIRTAVVPEAIGWSAVALSLAALIVLPVATPGDVYFPVLHHVAPLAIGIALL